MFLVGYHETPAQALGRIGDVRRATIQPFAESWNHGDYGHVVSLDIENEMSDMVADVTNFIRRIRHEVLTEDASRKYAWTHTIPFIT